MRCVEWKEDNQIVSQSNLDRCGSSDLIGLDTHGQKGQDDALFRLGLADSSEQLLHTFPKSGVFPHNGQVDGLAFDAARGVLLAVR